MHHLFEQTNAPYIPSEENFNDKPQRTSTENKKGMEAFFKEKNEGLD